jgi:hypothetical protein
MKGGADVALLVLNFHGSHKVWSRIFLEVHADFFGSTRYTWNCTLISKIKDDNIVTGSPL